MFDEFTVISSPRDWLKRSCGKSLTRDAECSLKIWGFHGRFDRGRIIHMGFWGDVQKKHVHNLTINNPIIGHISPGVLLKSHYSLQKNII